MAGKVKYNQLTDLEKKKYLGDFYSMVSLLKNREEVKNFFKDLLTLSEVVMISRRLQIAQLLLEGMSYEAIRGKLKVGFTTINSVDTWLNNGFGGYRNTINNFKKKGKVATKQKPVTDFPFSLNHLRKKYPAHFLLLNMFKKDN